VIFGIKEMKEFASNHEDPRVVAIWLRLEEVRSKTSKWCNRLVELKKANDKLRDLLKRALPYVAYEDMQVANHGGTCTDHAQLADEIRQAIGPLPGEGGE